MARFSTFPKLETKSNLPLLGMIYKMNQDKKLVELAKQKEARETEQYEYEKSTRMTPEEIGHERALKRSASAEETTKGIMSRILTGLKMSQSLDEWNKDKEDFKKSIENEPDEIKAKLEPLLSLDFKDDTEFQNMKNDILNKVGKPSKWQQLKEEFHDRFPDMKDKEGTPEWHKKMLEYQKEQANLKGTKPNTIELTERAVNGDPNAIAILDEIDRRKSKAYAEGRGAVFGTIPTSTPGIVYDRMKKKWFKVGEDGEQQELTSKDVLNETLKYKEKMPTNDIRVMQQSVPSVMHLIGSIRKSIEKTTTGPFAGRWKDLWSGKVGASDPNFRSLATAVNLLQTRLMKMHVGARGGQYVMEHFERFINAGKDAPENLIAAIDMVEDYAKEVAIPITYDETTKSYKQEKIKQPSDMSDDELLKALGGE